MLVLTRKIHETIIIGENIRVAIVAIRGRYVRLAIEAPAEVAIVREELEREPGQARSVSSRRAPSPQPVPTRREMPAMNPIADRAHHGWLPHEQDADAGLTAFGLTTRGQREASGQP